MKKIFALILAGALLAGPVYAGVIRKTVSSAGTAEALSSSKVRYRYITVCAETDNTGVVVLGDSSVVASLSTRKGVPLLAGDCVTYPQTDSFYMLDHHYIDTTISGDGVTVNYLT